MIPVFQQLFPLLKLAEFFPNIKVSFASREEFVRDVVAESDVTIFTDANIDLAITKTVETKTFNSGQDCAGPDNILIHRDIADAFIDGLKSAVNDVKVGSYTDPDVTVGLIAEDGSLTCIASLLQQHRSDIVFGSGINFASTIVSPTIIVAPLSRTTNYKEFFSPVFFVNIYDSDDQLADYFQDPQYAANEIHGASFVATGSNIEARPILVPKEISQYIASTSITPIGADAIRELTSEMGMTYDSVWPSEIITKSELEHMLLEAKTITFDAVGTSYSFWLEDVQVRIHALAGCKKGMTGDLALLREVEKATGKYPKLWKAAIFAELDELASRDPDAEILQSLNLESLRRLEGSKLMKFMHENIWCHLQGEKAESSAGDSSDEDGSSVSGDESLPDSVESMNGSCESLNPNMMNAKAIAC
ncbi:putative aldehyde dehydrogenase yfmT [Glarea lozoyensis 74030]|uniref:Putative aldehyde dehydrogenase yfmT n=1 Tax=Glarea lozoyensis (strain ATCC 74030 / MF5533) TaxID=1104152 RepID=H0EXB3_GLAL7|nr:putative aldehyde dehydrogenase yfmT [Glarea lozoyensis 74030]